MVEYLIGFAYEYTYIGMTLLIFIENIFPPIPSECILLCGGYMAHNAGLNIVFMIFCATTGSITGALVLYYLGYILGSEKIKRFFCGKAGKLLCFNADDFSKAQKYFDRCGGKAVLVCRCIPVVRSIVSIPAGIVKMNLVKFIALTFAGSAVWNTVIILLGYKLGDSWQKAEKWLGIYSDVVLSACILTALTVALILLKRKRKSRDKK